MPALPPTPSPVLKCNIQWGVEGDDLAQTVHYFTCASGPTAGDLATFAGFLVSQGETNFAALASNYTGMTAATVRDLSSDMGAESTGGTPWVGTRGTELLPPSAAVLVNHAIARHYRGGRPRTYLPLGISSDIATTGLWTTGFSGDVETAWGDWTAAVQAYSSGSVVVDKIVNISYYGPPNRTITGSTGRVRTISTVRTTPIIDVITSHSTSRTIASQRRRNRDA